MHCLEQLTSTLERLGLRRSRDLAAHANVVFLYGTSTLIGIDLEPIKKMANQIYGSIANPMIPTSMS